MAKVSAGKAAKMTGKSIPTITRAIKDKRLSAGKKRGGGYEIEVSELERVFDIVSVDGNDTPKTLDHVTANDNSALEREIELLRERLTDKDSTIDDLRERLDREGEERRQLTAVLTDMRTRTPEPSRSWWPFGRKQKRNDQS